MEQQREVERQRGPGLYKDENIQKGLISLSQSQSLRVFKFSNSQRDYNYMRIGDKKINVAPGQYDSTRKAEKDDFAYDATGIGADKKRKDFDPRKVSLDLNE